MLIAKYILRTEGARRPQIARIKPPVATMRDTQAIQQPTDERKNNKTKKKTRSLIGTPYYGRPIVKSQTPIIFYFIQSYSTTEKQEESHEEIQM